MMIEVTQVDILSKRSDRIWINPYQITLVRPSGLTEKHTVIVLSSGETITIKYHPQAFIGELNKITTL